MKSLINLFYMTQKKAIGYLRNITGSYASGDIGDLSI